MVLLLLILLSTLSAIKDITAATLNNRRWHCPSRRGGRGGCIDLVISCWATTGSPVQYSHMAERERENSAMDGSGE